MKPYPRYKDSGVEWIGVVPEGWGVQRSKRIAKIVNGSTPKTGIAEYWNGDIVWVTPADISKVSSLKISGSEKKITYEGLNNCGASIVPQGSIILTTRAPIGNLAIANNSLCTNQGCKSLIPTNVYSPYLFYFLFVSKEILQSIGSGTTFKELSTDNLASFMIVLPPKYEQKSIAAYLDRKTTQIDNLISKKQKLIELLKEERSAIINQAVTKGLNPDASMKNSGIEWLGEVPEHWEIERLKYTIRVRSGDGITNEEMNQDGKYEVYGGNGFIGYSDKFNVKSDSIIIGRVGAKCGNVRYLKGEKWISDNALILKSDQDYTYLKYLLESLNLNHLANQNAQPLITSSMVKLVVVTLPNSLEEQKLIANFINAKTKAIDQTISRIEKQTALLQEFRTALISEVVTGKIDVRT